jgi:polysaccharide biosynthesis protein PslH
MRSLRIPVVMVEPPLPFGDATARWFYVLLKGLVSRGHRVTAFAACTKPVQMEATRDLFPAPEYDLRLHAVEPRGGLAAKWSTLCRPYSYLFSAALEQDVRTCLAENFDILHLEHLLCGYLGLYHATRTLSNVHYLMSIDLGSATPGFGRWSKERMLGFPIERRMLRRFRYIRTCTPRLESVVRKTNPNSHVTTVPLARELSLYPWVPSERRGQDRPNVTLIGSMSWMPGVSAALRLLTRLWPEIARRVPAARLTIIGWNARTALREFLDVPGVTIVENVPDARPYFEAAGVLVYAPERGSGMKIKVLEAMAFGVPVVTTTEGVEGLPALHGVHVGVCDDDAGLVERTVARLTDRELQDRQRTAAQALLAHWCDPSRTVTAVEAIHARMLGG